MAVTNTLFRLRSKEQILKMPFVCSEGHFSFWEYASAYIFVSPLNSCHWLLRALVYRIVIILYSPCW